MDRQVLWLPGSARRPPPRLAATLALDATGYEPWERGGTAAMDRGDAGASEQVKSPSGFRVGALTWRAPAHSGVVPATLALDALDRTRDLPVHRIDAVDRGGASELVNPPSLYICIYVYIYLYNRGLPWTAPGTCLYTGWTPWTAGTPAPASWSNPSSSLRYYSEA